MLDRLDELNPFSEMEVLVKGAKLVLAGSVAGYEVILTSNGDDGLLTSMSSGSILLVSYV